MLLYGSIDGCQSVYADKQVASKIDALAAKLHWCESSIRLTPKAVESNASAEKESETSAPRCSTPLEAKEEKVSFTGPVDAKLLRGLDGHVYALDFIRSQPVDCFWIQEELKRDAQSAGASQFIHRPELIEHMITQRAELEERAKMIKDMVAKREKGEKVEDVTEEQLKQLEAQLPMIETTVKTLPTSFDVNCFTPYSATTAAVSRDEKGASTAKETDVVVLSNFLVNQMLPMLHEQLKEYSLNNQDGSKIVQLMHSSGVNVRYLGYLAELCCGKGLKEAAATDVDMLRACESEMIARASKQILTVLLSDEELAAAPAYTVAAFLNALVAKKRDDEVCLEALRKKKAGAKTGVKVPEAIARDLAERSITGLGVWAMIRKLVASKFHYTCKIWDEKVESAFAPAECDRVMLLRRVCILMGIQLASKKYDMDAACVLEPADIEGFAPRVKYSHTSLLDDSLIQLFQQCSILLSQGQLHLAFACCRQIVITAVSACHMLHPIAIRALTTMASILFSLKDFSGAVRYNRLALRCTERAYGVDSIESAICHSQLSDSLGRAGGLHESILHYKISLDIYLMACSDHSEEIGEIYANLGLLYKQLVFNDKAVACLRIALSKLQKSHPLYLRVVRELTQCCE